MNNKIDARLKSIEEQLSSAQKSTDSSAKRTSNVESLNEHRSTGVNQVSNFFHPNGFSALKNSSLLNNATLIKTMPNSKNCSCEVGDVDSCQVMQDVKNSIYRLNDILSSSFVPSLGNTVISGFNQPTSNYSGSVQSFYSQFRQLQEKQRINELKHKLQNESRGQHSRILDTRDRNYSADFTRNDSSGFNHALNSNVYTINSSDDPISRARNLVLREQARSWKQQQQYLSSTDMQGFLPLERNYIGSRSDNISPSPSSRISSGLSEHSSTNLPFLKFEPDPETEYNEWMSRLKSLQDKIRSHKIL